MTDPATPMVQVAHLLLTKFNIERLQHLQPGRHLGLDPNWLEHRFAVFETLCFPTVKQQTRTDFIWLLFLHPDTPERYRTRIAALTKQFANLLTIYTRTLDRDKESRILAKLNIRAEWLITTRLDNDDMISRFFVEDIYKAFEPRNHFFINFLYGYNFCLNDGSVRRQRSERNMFSSYVRLRASAHTLFFGDHSKIDHIGPIKNIDTRPLWCQVIHGRNLLNGVRGTRVSSRRFESDFLNRSSIDLVRVLGDKPVNRLSLNRRTFKRWIKNSRNYFTALYYRLLSRRAHRKGNRRQAISNAYLAITRYDANAEFYDHLCSLLTQEGEGSLGFAQEAKERALERRNR